MKGHYTLLHLLCYFLMLAVALPICVGVWNGSVNGTLYHCTDPGLVDLIPPFVHPGSDDTHTVPIWLLDGIWGCFVLAALVGPAIVLWAVRRLAGPDVDESEAKAYNY